MYNFRPLRRLLFVFYVLTPLSLCLPDLSFSCDSLTLLIFIFIFIFLFVPYFHSDSIHLFHLNQLSIQTSTLEKGNVERYVSVFGFSAEALLCRENEESRLSSRGLFDIHVAWWS